jgi:site-specific DNA recombinase
MVRKRFEPGLSGKGPSHIARDLKREKILTSTADYNAVGKKKRNPMPVKTD